MQVTIELPDELAPAVEAKRAQLAAILAHGLRQAASEACPLAQEVVALLARGPSPEAIIAFGPSAHSIERARELLEKNRAGELGVEEQAELDEMARVNQLFTLIRIQARLNLDAAA